MNYLKITHTVNFIVFFIILMNQRSCIEGHPCREQNFFYEQRYSGYVLKRYIDTNNHNFKVVIIKGLSDPIIFAVDNSGFFSFVKPGDFIDKEKKSKFLIVIRGKTKTQFKINFFCEE
jgi:hypothetical protein